MTSANHPSLPRWLGPMETVAIVGGLTTFAAVRATLVPEWGQFPANVAATVAFAVVARMLTMDLAELGLQRRTAPNGLRWGGILGGVVVLTVLGASFVPAGADAFAAAGVDLDIGGVLWRVLAVIPLGTVLLEELAFRGVLWASLRRWCSDLWTLGISSVLFGLWHIPPALADVATGEGPTATTDDLGAGPNVAGTILATTIAGVVFGWLRLRTDSLWAPILVHATVNTSSLVAAAALS